MIATWTSIDMLYIFTMKLEVQFVHHLRIKETYEAE